MELGISERWHHPAHAHLEGCAHAHPAAPAHIGRMSAELGIGQAIGGVIATGWLALAAHHLTVREFGQLTLVLSLGALVSTGTDLGIPLALTKLSCDHDVLDRAAVDAAIRRRVVAGLAATPLLVGLWANSGGATRWWLGGLYGISVTASPVTGSFLALLRGRAIGSVEGVYSVASKLALPALGLSALAAGLGVGGVIVSYAAVDSIGAIIVSRIAERRLSFFDQRDPTETQELRLRSTLPLATAGILGSAYERIDIWLVALLKGTASVALYAAAYKLYDAVLMPARAVGSASVAAAGRDIAGAGRRAVIRLAGRAVAITIPIAGLGAWAAPHVLKVAFGSHFGKASSAVELLMAATIPGAALAVLTPVALLSRRRFVVVATSLGLAANVVANVGLVPTIGVTGAALAFLITESSLLLAFTFALSSRTRQPEPLRSSPPPTR